MNLKLSSKELDSLVLVATSTRKSLRPFTCVSGPFFKALNYPRIICFFSRARDNRK